MRFNQMALVSLTLGSLLLGSPALLALTALALLLGTACPPLAPFKNLYTRVLRPLLRLPVRRVDDDPRAHNFAQGMGGSVLTLASLAYLGGLPLLGTALAVVVVALALLNLTTGYCLGCQLYFHYRMLRHRLTR
nr:DUF4395 domain-containing protein [Deinobacterium chartae]